MEIAGQFWVGARSVRVGLKNYVSRRFGSAQIVSVRKERPGLRTLITPLRLISSENLGSGLRDLPMIT